MSFRRPTLASFGCVALLGVLRVGLAACRGIGLQNGQPNGGQAGRSMPDGGDG